MFIPTISIERLRPGLYGWQASTLSGLPASQMCDSSLAQCLEDALGCISPHAELVEILYCDAHMGTMQASDVRRASKEVARQIKSLHSALVETA